MMNIRFSAVVWGMTIATMWMAGCGSAPVESAPLGIYAGVITLLPGGTPSCSEAADPSANCCDETQVTSLSYGSFSDGLAVDGWPAYVDANGTVNWQETDTETDASENACTDDYVSSEHLTRYGAYSYVETSTQTCGAASRSFQCAYAGQLTLQ